MGGKYSFTNPPNVLATYSDIELKFLQPDNVTVYSFNATTGYGDLHMPIKPIPASDVLYDLVIVPQTLEHLYDPYTAVHNIFDVVAPGWVPCHARATPHAPLIAARCMCFTLDCMHARRQPRCVRSLAGMRAQTGCRGTPCTPCVTRRRATPCTGVSSSPLSRISTACT
jgi:hypothetical protein